MTLNFVIIDDYKPALDSTCNYIKKFLKENCIDAHISLSTTNPKEVLAYSHENATKPNVYVLDINLKAK